MKELEYETTSFSKWLIRTYLIRNRMEGRENYSSHKYIDVDLLAPNNKIILENAKFNGNYRLGE